MAAIRSDWMPAVACRRKMKLAFTLLILLLTGLPPKGDCTAPAADSKSPSAQECRQHVEKALDQYFESNQGDQKKEQDNTVTQVQTPQSDKSNGEDDDNDDDGDEPLSTIPEKRETEDADEDDDEDDEDEDEDDSSDDETDDVNEEKKDLRKNSENENDKILEDDDENDESKEGEDEEDEEDDDEEDEEESVGDKQPAKLDANLIEDEDENDDDGEDEDEDEDEINQEDEDNNNDDDDDDNENREDSDSLIQDNVTKTAEFQSSAEKYQSKSGSEKSQEEEEEEKDGNDDDEMTDGSDEDEDEEDEEEEDEDKDEDEDDTEDEKENNRDKDEADEKKDIEAEDEKDEGGKDVDDKDSETQKSSETETVTPQTSQDKTSALREKLHLAVKEVQDELEISPDKTSALRAKLHLAVTEVQDELKATGGADSATVRVAQKLPGGKPPSEQPKAQEVLEKEETVIIPPKEETNQAKVENKTVLITENEDNDEDDDEEGDDDEDDDEQDDLIENIYEDDDDDIDNSPGSTFRSRDHIDTILNLDDIGTGYDLEEDKLAMSIFRDIKKIHAASIKPMEMLYKFTDSTSRLLGDAEIFNKPMILFLGPWSTGKTTILNYLLGIERIPEALKTGSGITDVDFTVITYGDKRQTVSGTELAVDWRYASLQKFGQGFLDHFKAITIPHTLLKKINLVDTPAILENRKNLERGYPFNDAFQWFIDRADAIYVVLDPTKVDVGAELGTVVDQLKGRDIRFILNKADTIRRSDLMRVVGQLFWNLSPLMGSSEAPVIYAVSLSSKPFNPTAPARFLTDQENNFLYDLKDVMDKRVENRILYARRHAVRVRNHAKMVDCYLATYYRHKSIFSNKKNVAKMITENPLEYHIYDGLGSLSNISRYDLPDVSTYKNFFNLHPLYDFRPLASTCSYFRGCPMDKLDAAISSELPELLAKYKKAKNDTPSPAKQEGR